VLGWKSSATTKRGMARALRRALSLLQRLLGQCTREGLSCEQFVTVRCVVKRLGRASKPVARGSGRFAWIRQRLVWKQYRAYRVWERQERQQRHAMSGTPPASVTEQEHLPTATAPSATICQRRQRLPPSAAVGHSSPAPAVCQAYHVPPPGLRRRPMVFSARTPSSGICAANNSKTTQTPGAGCSVAGPPYVLPHLFR
jgi:hypothetical protein